MIYQPIVTIFDTPAINKTAWKRQPIKTIGYADVKSHFFVLKSQEAIKLKKSSNTVLAYSILILNIKNFIEENKI